ncbi:MAG: lipid II flippase MurJ, partial [bacterium]
MEDIAIKTNIARCWNRIRSRPLVWDTITTTLWSTSGKAVGFIIPFLIAAWYGLSSETDALFYAYGLIVLLANIFSPVVETIIVPFIAEARARGEDVGAFVGNILGTSLIGIALIGIPLVLASGPFVSAITRFSPEQLHLVSQIIMESSPLLVLLVWTSILAGTLNAYMNFRIPAISPAVRAIVTLGFIYALKNSLGIHAIAWGYVLGEIGRLALLFVLIRRLNSFTLRISFGVNEKLLHFLKTSSYQMIAMSILVFMPIINKTMASWIGTGNVSLLEYAERVYMIPITFLTSGFVVTILSHWSERYHRGGEESLRQDVLKAALLMGWIGVITTGCLLSVHGPLV